MFTTVFLRAFLTSVIPLFLAFIPYEIMAETKSHDCEIDVDIADFQVTANSQIAIPITIDNYFDTIVGFRIWVQIDRPEVIKFRVDSAIRFDTIGTLISGWEFIDARSISGTGADIQITGIANLFPPPVTRGFAPQQGGTLIRLLADVLQINDPFGDSLVLVEINPFYPEHLEFVNPAFDIDLWQEVEFWDTIGYVCEQWQIDSTQNPPDTIGCLNWVQTPNPPWDDTVEILDTMLVLDTSVLCLTSGTIEIISLPPYFCGDLNGDSAVGNILDLTFAVDRVFRGGPLPGFPEASDVNCDGTNCNILDLTAIVDRVFRGGGPLCNGGWCL
jgi:hypothetical protein